MPLPLPSRLRPLTLLLACSLAGCQSAHYAFQFQPAAPGLTGETAVSTPKAAPPALAPTEKHLAAPAQSPQSEPTRPRALRAARRHQARGLAAPAGPRRLATMISVRSQQLRPRNRAAQPAAAMAENGLGTTFLGVLGILALLVGLIGLLVGGGGFFGLLAAGGAVALLISIFVPILTRAAG